MKKKFYLKGLLSLLLLVVGINAWGATTVASYSRSGSTNTTSGGTFTTNFKTATDYLQDNSTAQDYYLQILNTTAYWTTTPQTITLNAKIGGGTAKDLSSSPIKVDMLDKDGNVLSSTTVTTKITTATGDDYSITISPVNNVAGFKLYHTKVASYNARFYSASLVYEAAQTSGPTAPTFSLAAGTYKGSQTTTITIPSDAAGVQYTIDGTDPTDDNNNPELITSNTDVTISSSCTLRAVSVDNSSNFSSEVSRAYVIKKSIDNTTETAYTVSEAIEKYNDSDNYLADPVYVKGTVSEITTEWSDTYNNITYAISEDGTTTSTQFLLYRCATNGFVAGDDVVAYGTLSTYSSAVQMAAGNTIVASTKATTFSIDDVVVALGETINQSIATNIPLGQFTITYESSNTDIVATNDENTAIVTGSKTGIATITATITADGYKTATTTFTVTVTSAATLKSIIISGKPTTTYTVGDSFDTSTLTATGNYSDEASADLTSTVTWTVEPETLTAATTSVTVKATRGEISGTKEYTVTVNKKTASITIADIEIGKNATDVAISATTTPEDATLTYEITEGSDYITLTDGKISAVAPGTATVKASYAGTDEYASAETTFTVTVIDASVATYTFSEFTSADDVSLTDLDGFTITLSKGTGSTKPAWSSSQARIYAKGTLTVKATNANIKSIVYEYTVNTNKSGTVPTIDGVAGTTTAGTWDADTKTWTGSDSEVTFSTSGSAGNVGFTKLTITYEQGTKEETSLAWSASEATVTMEANDNVFPTLTTTPANLEGVTYESSATSVATIADDGTITLVAPGTTTITAKFAGNDTYTEATPASYTLTVNEAPFVPIVVDAGYETVDFTSVYSTVTSGSQEVGTYKGTSFKAEFSQGTHKTSKPTYYANGTAVRAYEGNTITITGAEDIKYVKVNYVSGYVDDAATTSYDGKTAVVTFSKTCRFTSITVSYKSESLAVSAAGYATYYNSTVAYYMPEDLTGYIFDSTEKKIVETYAAGSIVPAGEALVLGGEAKDYTLIYADGSGVTKSTANELCGTDEAATTEGGDTYYYYGLSLAAPEEGEEADPNTVGFYWMNTTGAAFTNGAHKAYLKLAKGSGAKAAFLFNDDTPTAVWNVDADVNGSEGAIYNLAGQRVNANAKGIVIKNGKKFINK